ncbi:MAG: cytochrome b/b6 domain-containing protein, partial [Marivita lacus]|nr:cytochrome b/b6 domain-containing protein [Marivita lacus]
MPVANTTAQYGAVAKTFHWLTALGILAVIPLGIIANDLPYDTAEQLADKAWLFSLHKTIGVTLFFVALARILWALSQPKPAPLHPDRKTETLLAEIVHWLLYGSLVLVPLSGWIHHAATEGFA